MCLYSRCANLRVIFRRSPRCVRFKCSSLQVATMIRDTSTLLLVHQARFVLPENWRAARALKLQASREWLVHDVRTQ